MPDPPDYRCHVPHAEDVGLLPQRAGWRATCTLHPSNTYESSSGEREAETPKWNALPDREMDDFMLALSVLGGVAGQSLQDNLFPGVRSESDFQSEIRNRLRMHPRIGSQLEEHPRAAGGITDLSFRGIRIELKVECNQVVTEEVAKRFIGQTAQYVTGSDRRLGILCILDCTPKQAAPGSAANDIFLTEVPPPHARGLPLLVGVVIIRGNLALPSQLSRGRGTAS